MHVSDFNCSVTLYLLQVSGQEETIFLQFYDYHALWCSWYFDFILYHITRLRAAGKANAVGVKKSRLCDKVGRRIPVPILSCKQILIDGV